MRTRAKIVATVGPACETKEMLSRMVDAGVSVFRLNIKHGSPAWHASVIQRIKALEKEKGSHIGVIIDLKGPETRIGRFRGEGAFLHKGAVVLFTDRVGEGDSRTIVVSNRVVLKGVKIGQRVLIDDGKVELRVISKPAAGFTAKVVRGGEVSSNKTLNLPDTDLDIPALASVDLKHIAFGNARKVDYFALSFVRDSRDVKKLRSILRKKGSAAKIISKIERPQAIANFDSILESSDAIMIGRGDLGVEIPPQKVPLVQKGIIAKCRRQGKPVITATHMLESMIKSPMPTRAEVSDVANAILDGTDAVMLSAESASGMFPTEAVTIMADIDRAIRESPDAPQWMSQLPHQKPETTTEAISQAVDALSRNPIDFRAIVLFTETGTTAREIAKFRPSQPVYAVTRDEGVASRLSVVWGVTPVMINFAKAGREILFPRIFGRLKELGFLSSGDRVICVSGKLPGRPGFTDSITIQSVQ